MATAEINLVSRIASIFVADREFTNDKGEKIKYQKLVVRLEIKDEPLELDFKLDKKDATLLQFADTIHEDLVEAE